MHSFLRGAREGLRQLASFAEANGWTITRTPGGHIKFSKHGCSSIFTSCTSSDHRSDRNALASLRRAGRTSSSDSKEAI